MSEVTGRDPSGQALAPAASSQQAVSPLTGFDPSRIVRPGFDQRLSEFEDRLFGVRWIAERVMAGQQFNCFETAGEWEEDEDREYSLCIGPISDARYICGIEGKGQADLVEAALKVATEAFREKAAHDARPLEMPSDPAWYAKMAELEGDSEIGAGILHPEAALRDSDGNPQGGDGTAPSRSDDSAGRETASPGPSAPSSSSETSGDDVGGGR